LDASGSCPTRRTDAQRSRREHRRPSRTRPPELQLRGATYPHASPASTVQGIAWIWRSAPLRWTSRGGDPAQPHPELQARNFLACSGASVFGSSAVRLVPDVSKFSMPSVGSKGSWNAERCLSSDYEPPPAPSVGITAQRESRRNADSGQRAESTQEALDARCGPDRISPE
jgi:hypothetical protein